MGKTDGKVTLSTKIDTSGIKDGAKNIKSALSDTKSAMAGLASSVAAAFSVAALMNFSKQSGEVATQTESNIQRIVDVFGSASQEVSNFIDANARAIGMSKSAAAGFSAVYGNLFSVWADQQQNAQLTNKYLNMTAVVASKTGRTMADTQERIRSGLLGNTEAIEDLGVFVNVKTIEMTSAFQRVANGRSWEQLSANEQQQVRTLAILEQATKKYGTEVADTSALTRARYQAAYEDFRSTWGQVVNVVLIPVLKVMTEIFNVAIKGMQSLFGLSSSTSEATSEYANNINAASKNQANLNKNLNKTNKELKKATAGFDTIQVLSTNSSTESDIPNFNDFDLGSISQTVNVTANVNDEDLDAFYEKLQAILALVGAVGIGIAAWTFLDLYTSAAKTAKVLTALKTATKGIASTALIIAGAFLLIKGYTEAWVDGVGWDDLLLVLGGISVILIGVGMKFGSYGVAAGLLAAGVAAIVLGVKDFVKNGPSLQNTILIIGGAIATAVGLATMGVGPLIAAIIGAVAAVAGFVAAILLEEEAILSTKEAQEQLTAAKEAAKEAENGYINAVDASEAAQKRLAEAEKAAGVTGKELYKKVQSGTLDYANMTDAQKEVYKAYLDNIEKQKELAESTATLNAAKKAETLASLDNEIALGKEAGSYDKCKESIIAAYEEGAISAEECRDLLSKSMSEMSTDAQKTFMEDIPSNIKEGLNPNKYETTRKKIGDWFKDTGKSIATWWTDYFWKGITDWWNAKVVPIFTTKFWKDLAIKAGNGLIDGFEGAINGIIGLFEKMINWVVKGINSIGFDVPDWLQEKIGFERFGLNIPEVKFKRVSIPRLAQGAVIPPNREFMAVLGDQKHGTNIEAPLETIKQALAEVLAMQEGGIETVTTINFTGDLAQLARVLKPKIDAETRRKGGSLASGGTY